MNTAVSESRVTILGAGAMGCLFGFLLARQGARVTLVDRLPEEVAAIRRDGLTLWSGVDAARVRVAAETDPARVPRAPLLLLCVKAHQTRSALPTLEALVGSETLVLSLQNGLGAADALAARLDPSLLLVGTTAQGATQLGPGEVRHGGTGTTVFGPFAAPGPTATWVAGLLHGAGIPARFVADPWPFVWKKLAVNCGINALTALTGVLNGRITEIPQAAELLADAVAETVRVARGKGVDLGDPGRVVEEVLAVARATAANRSSMGQDVDRRVATEIDFINGAVERTGAALGIATPVNQTLTRLIKTLEATF